MALIQRKWGYWSPQYKKIRAQQPFVKGEEAPGWGSCPRGGGQTGLTPICFLSETGINELQDMPTI